MALKSLANNMGMLLHSDGGLILPDTFTGVTLDAAGESKSYIGRVFLEAGTGSKTISSSGGIIGWRTATVGSFSNAGTNIRVGIQDVNSSGIEDGVFDVYADLIGGTDVLTTNTDQQTLMKAKSKTISHGDLIAVSIEMTSRGGTDSVQVGAMTSGISPPKATTTYYPYATTDTGSGPTKTATAAIGCSITFDDGTIGWIEPGILPDRVNSVVTTSFGVNSTPDEYGALLNIPFKCRISGGYFSVGSVATTDTFEIVLYSSPSTTPTIIETIVIDPQQIGSTSATVGPYYFKFSTPRILSPNTEYVLAVRPTSSGTITLASHNFGSKYKVAFPFGSSLNFVSRTNQSGSFSVVNANYIPWFGLMIDQLDDGIESGFIVT